MIHKTLLALVCALPLASSCGANKAEAQTWVPKPARWYYHADKLGLLVWQDMPSGSSYLADAPPLDKSAFEKQLVSAISSHWNSPAIVM